ncbi:MAG: glycosyltransferase [Thermoleophilaceae bacterium]
MFTFLYHGFRVVTHGASVTPFMWFFLYVWTLWAAKALGARRYRPWCDEPSLRRTTVLVPVYNEPEATFRRALASVRFNQPTEMIAVVDGGDAHTAAVAREYCDQVILIERSGKRSAIAAGLEASDPSTDVVVVLDSDTVWEAGALRELLKPFEDPRVGGVTPRQAIFDVGRSPVRRLADWIEDIRYHLTVPAQSVFGQVGCLAGRTIAYRRAAFEPAVDRMARQHLFGIPLQVGDDRVLTNELLRNGWRTVYQSTALVHTDAPSGWRGFWRQQLRWGRSSQRETLLSLPWLWRRPVAFVSFITDIATPFALYAIMAVAVAHAIRGDNAALALPVIPAVALAYTGMLVSIGVRQVPHLRRVPSDVRRLPVFVLQLTFVMVPLRIVAFATMMHQGWGTRPAPAEGAE